MIAYGVVFSVFLILITEQRLETLESDFFNYLLALYATEDSLSMIDVFHEGLAVTKRRVRMKPGAFTKLMLEKGDPKERVEEYISILFLNKEIRAFLNHIFSLKLAPEQLNSFDFEKQFRTRCFKIDTFNEQSVLDHLKRDKYKYLSGVLTLEEIILFFQDIDSRVYCRHVHNYREGMVKSHMKLGSAYELHFNKCTF